MSCSAGLRGAGGRAGRGVGPAFCLLNEFHLGTGLTDGRMCVGTPLRGGMMGREGVSA